MNRLVSKSYTVELGIAIKSFYIAFTIICLTKAKVLLQMQCFRPYSCTHAHRPSHKVSCVPTKLDITWFWIQCGVIWISNIHYVSSISSWQGMYLNHCMQYG